MCLVQRRKRSRSDGDFSANKKTKDDDNITILSDDDDKDDDDNITILSDDDDKDDDGGIIILPDDDGDDSIVWDDTVNDHVLEYVDAIKDQDNKTHGSNGSIPEKRGPPREAFWGPLEQQVGLEQAFNMIEKSQFEEDYPDRLRATLNLIPGISDLLVGSDAKRHPLINRLGSDDPLVCRLLSEACYEQGDWGCYGFWRSRYENLSSLKKYYF